MANERLELALHFARQALDALAADDTVAFEELWPEHEAACDALSGLGASTSPADRQALDELIAIELRVARAIQDVLAGTAERMATLRRGEQTHAAYAAASRFA
jgi:hypothetical protein